MSTPTRDEAIEILREGHAAIRAQLEGVPAGELTRPGTIGGGEWSAKDLLGHLAACDEDALRSLDEWSRGERPWSEQPFDVDEVNAEAVGARASRPLERIREEFESVHAELVRRLEAITEQGWNARSPYATDRPRSLGAMLGSVLGAAREPFAHASAHLPDVEAFARSLGGPDPGTTALH